MKAEIWNKSGWITDTDPFALRRQFNAALSAAGFTVLSFAEYHFEPFGYTALWLLGESHCALHTFPEESKTYYELSSCVESLFNKFEILENAKGKATN